MKKITLLIIPGLICGFLLLQHCKTNNNNVKSVILITIDTLRANQLSCYGYHFQTSPNIDSFISKGTRFEWAFSTSPQTAPSHASILVGFYPGFNSVGFFNGTYRLLKKEITLAELCRLKGLKTAAIISNPVLRANVGFDQGFDSYDDKLDKRELNRISFEQTADTAIDKTISKLDSLKHSRFFLWLHLQDPHGPYTPPDEFLAKFSNRTTRSIRRSKELPISNIDFGYKEIPFYQKYQAEKKVWEYINRYDGEIAFLDSQLKRLFSYIESHKLLQDTLIVITADHGEALGEDDFYFVHGHSCGLDQTRVPLAFIGPGILSRNVYSDHAVSNIDIFATVLDYLDIVPPEKRQSVSLKNILEKGKDNIPRTVFFESRSQRGVVYKNILFRRDRFHLEKGDYFFTEDRKGRRWRKGFLSFREQFLDLGYNEGINGTLKNKLRKILHEFSLRSNYSYKRIKEDRIPTIISNRLQKKLQSLGYID